jgi:hypothetical protein
MAKVSGRERILENPFYVLGLKTNCLPIEVEREGQKLLAMLELKLESASRYPTPVGASDRSPEKVRHAMAELRDPAKRLAAEVWAMLDPNQECGEPAEEATPSGLPGARGKLGWGTT